MGAVETLLIWEELPLRRLHLRNPQTCEEHLNYIDPERDRAASFICAESGVELDLVESVPFVEWVVQNYKSINAKVEFVSDRSLEGRQFCRGLGGIGGLLRYR